METNRRSCLLFLLLALLHACTANDCPLTDAVFTEFTCYNDYNSIISCVWSSRQTSVHTNSVCTVDARKTEPPPRWNSNFSHRNCVLKPVDASKPALMSCSMDLGKPNAFQHFEKWSIDVKCNSSDHTLNVIFKPSCSIKLNPPENPAVNFTSVSWTIQSPSSEDIECVKSELQWKQEDQSWNDSSVKTVPKFCKVLCETELLQEELVEGQRYEARVRALVCDEFVKSIWSDWSPTTSWVSRVGNAKAPGGDVWGMIAAGAVTFAVFLFVVFVRTNTTTWVVGKLKGSPIPSPEMSFLQKNWMSPHFTSDSFHSFIKPEEILYVEVTSPVHAPAPFKPEAAFLEKTKSESSSGSGSSSFSNPSYSHLCSPPPFSSLSAGNLQPCAADTPYGPVVNQGASANAEQKQEDESREEPEILQLLSKGDKGNRSVQVISEYEKVEKVQMERVRLQSLDSGVCSSEEVSQESLESDSINVTDSLDEEPLDKEEEEEKKRGNEEEVDLKKLFRSSGGIFGKGSIQVCSGYERVQKLQDDAATSELPSLDSDVGSGGEKQVSQEDVGKATDSSSFPSSALPCPVPSFTHLKLPQLGNSPDLQTLLNHMMAKKPLMSESRSVEPSGDGYMPARQEVS